MIDDRFENLLEDFLGGGRKACFSNFECAFAGFIAALFYARYASLYLGGGSHSLGNVLAFRRGLKESGLLEM
jgi:hypothetical protein